MQVRPGLATCMPAITPDGPPDRPGTLVGEGENSPEIKVFASWFQPLSEVVPGTDLRCDPARGGVLARFVHNS